MYECTCACASTLFICKLKGGGVLYCICPSVKQCLYLKGGRGGGGERVRKNARAQKLSPKFLGAKFSSTVQYLDYFTYTCTLNNRATVICRYVLP
jgi:hypothetical protein